MGLLREIRLWLFWTFGIGKLPEFPSVHSGGRYYYSREHPSPIIESEKE